MSKKQDFVHQVIKDNPGVQNDDAALIAAVWRASGWSDERSLEGNISRVMHPETITRARRKLHEEGKITYSKDALKRRTEAFEEIQAENSLHEQIDWFGGMR